MFSLMQFKDFVWTKNPEKLSVSVTRDIKELEVPFYGAVMQDYGAKKRVISGEGEFSGKQCMQTYKALSDLFQDGGSGVLRLPNLPALVVKPISLSYVATTRPDVLRYKFLFWEDLNESLPASDNNPFRFYVTVKEDGESLWSIANQEHTTVEELVRLNPHIIWPSYLTAGERVVLS